MRTQPFLLVAALVVSALVVSACGGTAAPPDPYWRSYTYTRSDAMRRAARAYDLTRVAVAVERTPTPAQVYAGVVPALADGESIEWGVRRTWSDSHDEDEWRTSRACAEQAVRLTKAAAGRTDRPTGALIFRVFPAWAEIGTAS